MYETVVGQDGQHLTYDDDDGIIDKELRRRSGSLRCHANHIPSISIPAFCSARYGRQEPKQFISPLKEILKLSQTSIVTTSCESSKNKINIKLKTKNVKPFVCDRRTETDGRTTTMHY
jgi:hypothetical protein